jgi:PAS domain S-box-containing protein
MLVITVLLSILFQSAATILALRLIRITKRSSAWLLIAAAIALMTARRIESLVAHLSGTGGQDLVFELIGLVLSVLMLAGVHAIRPLLSDIVQARDDARAMSERLRLLSEEQSLLLEHSRDFIYRHDPRGMITYVSPAVEHITGYSQEEWRVHYSTHYTDNAANRAGIDVTNAMLSTAKAGPPYRVEVRHKDGGTVWLEVNKQPYLAEGNVAGFIGAARDITARVRLEAERERLITDLKDALANIKTLRGLLPICAGCKKVRDDKGYWQQIEAYVSDHTEAEFSHGLCPECALRYYPDQHRS